MKSLFSFYKVMRTFGWSPSDLELQVKKKKLKNKTNKTQKGLILKMVEQPMLLTMLLQISLIWSGWKRRKRPSIINFDSFVFQELIGEIDQDGNGSISFNEFVWLMTRWVGFRTKLVKSFSGRSKTPRSRTRSGRRSGFSTRRDMGSFVLQVIN